MHTSCNDWRNVMGTNPCWFIWLLGAVSLVPISEAIWTCSKESTSTTPRSTTTSNRCSTRYEVPVAEEEALEAALQRDPMAEYKYHFLCQNPPKESQGLQQRTDSHDDVLHPCEVGTFPPRLAGVVKMQLGYNVITDKLSSTTAHTPILDLISTEKFNATVKGPDGKCYLVPDAFVSLEKVGVSFDTVSSTDFGSIGTTTVSEFRERLAETRALEIRLHESGFENATRSALSGSESVTKLRQMAVGRGGDKSGIWHVIELYHAHIQTPIPTNDMVAEWSKLLKAATPTTAYHNYFNEFGTHYFESAIIGARFSVAFQVDTQVHLEGVSADVRAACVAAQVGKLFYTDAHFYFACKGKFSNALSFGLRPDKLVSRFHVRCEGGLSRLCPYQLNHDINKWRESIGKNPTVLQGQKRWITQLLEHVRNGAEGNGPGAEEYRKIVADLGGSAEVTKFIEQLKLELQKYLSQG